MPGPDHPIDLEKAGRRVVVRAGGAVVATSAGAIALKEANYPAVIYIPRSDVAIELLERSQTRTHCPYKGNASYYRMRGGAKDIAWSYEDPFESMDAIRSHLAFYPDRVDAIEMTPPT
ncbi:DUF427 domain-containing protein [Sphingobium sp. HWE2-09]|uniref:DUF427 domain-containing protein n=1 Tax=Sphingobium sp. HWE2-09 TaxID=3108390 RepID=UPI002DC38D8B|nr:DUF427 domain-containing protein [Sphingobium sp. HWE2-09]